MDDFLELLGTIGTVFDTPGSMLRAALAGEGKRAFTGVFNPEERVSGSEMLQSWGMDDPGLLGLGAELLFDPLNIAGGFALKGAMKGAKAAKAANAESQALRAMGAMPEEIANLTKVVDEAGKPKKLLHGTSQAFDKYDAEKLDPNALYGKGIYMTDAPEIASQYAEKGAIGGAKPGALDSLYALADNHLSNAPRKTRSQWDNDFSPRDEAYNAIDDWGNALTPQMPDDRLYPRLRELGVPDEALANLDIMAPLNVRQQFVDARNPFVMEKQYPIDEFNRIVRQDHPKADWSGTFINDMPLGESLYRIRDVDQANDLLRRAGYDAIQHVGGGRVGNVPHNVTIAFDPSQIYAPYIAQAMQQVPSPGKRLAALLAYNAAALPARGQ